MLWLRNNILYLWYLWLLILEILPVIICKDNHCTVFKPIYPHKILTKIKLFYLKNIFSVAAKY